MTRSRKFKKEYARELLRIAEQDLETAQALMKTKISRKENILFHIEQCVEKTLKAVLCKLEIAVPLVHELSILVDKLPAAYIPPHADELVDLTQFATIRRYEEGKASISQSELKAAYKIAQDISKWAKKI